MPIQFFCKIEWTGKNQHLNLLDRLFYNPIQFGKKIE
uniref:Uncharacterized protein n=1 Tax=viral metagenome TaxID=1070528 RepID=A0A6C0BBR2_9ZZZZ